MRKLLISHADLDAEGHIGMPFRTRRLYVIRISLHKKKTSWIFKVIRKHCNKPRLDRFAYLAGCFLSDREMVHTVFRLETITSGKPRDCATTWFKIHQIQHSIPSKWIEVIVRTQHRCWLMDFLPLILQQWSHRFDPQLDINLCLQRRRRRSLDWWLNHVLQVYLSTGQPAWKVINWSSRQTVSQLPTVYRKIYRMMIVRSSISTMSTWGWTCHIDINLDVQIIIKSKSS